MNTVQDVFDIAIRVMGENNDSTGETRTSDTKEYIVRTPSILNSILDQVYPASDTYPRGSASGKRPIARKVHAMTDELDLDEKICTNVLPYGLAGLLLTEENPELSDFYWSTYLENLNDCMASLPAVESAIVDVYNGAANIEFGQFSHW